jgi:hypothetical protein
MDTLTTFLLFLFCAGAVYFSFHVITFFLAQLRPPREAPGWLMAALALLSAVALVYFGIVLTLLPFALTWQQIASVLIFALAALIVAKRV